MSRRILSSFLTPLKSDGTPAAQVAGDSTLGTSNQGVVTLAAGTTYYLPLPAADVPWFGLQTQGDAAIVFTSITIEECYLPDKIASDYSDNVGEWFAMDIARISSEAEGTGWSATSDVIASNGSGAGGGVQNMQDCACRRGRAKIVVGATGGEARFTGWAKE